MGNLVNIKGTKSGIILVLDPNESFDNLKNEIATKFAEAADFLGKNNMGLIIRGRNLTDEEQSEVTSLIEHNSHLKISCIINEESDMEKLFAKAVNQNTDKQQKDEDEGDDLQTPDLNLAKIFPGNLRSGQDISCEESVVILGDVKPGANVISYGSIFILGELRGNAFAGAGGNRNAVVMALKLDPLQVRIADAIAIHPDAEKGTKLRLKRRKLSDNENEPEIAYIEGEHIVKSLYGPSFLRKFKFI